MLMIDRMGTAVEDLSHQTFYVVGQIPRRDTDPTNVRIPRFQGSQPQAAGHADDGSFCYFQADGN
jgi:hypothetical protein